MDGDKSGRRLDVSHGSTRRTAPAKVNLTLAVLGRRADGYHLLDSLVVFAAEADRLTLSPGGPLVAGGARRRPRTQAGPVESNLVFKAARALAAEIPGSQARPFHAGQAPAGRGRPRRRLVGCRRGVASAGPRQPPEALRPSAAQGRSKESAPTCRSASIRARGGCAASAKGCRRRCRSPSSRRCWSIRASRCRPGTCSRCWAESPAAPSPARHGRGRCRADRDALIELLAAGRNDLEPPAIKLQPAIARCA